MILITNLSCFKFGVVFHSLLLRNFTPQHSAWTDNAKIVHYTQHELIQTYLACMKSLSLLFCGKEDHGSLKQREHNK